MIKVEEIEINNGFRYKGEKDRLGVRITNEKRPSWPVLIRLSDMGDTGTVIIEDCSNNSIAVDLEDWDAMVKHIAEKRALLLGSSVV